MSDYMKIKQEEEEFKQKKFYTEWYAHHSIVQGPSEEDYRNFKLREKVEEAE